MFHGYDASDAVGKLLYITRNVGKLLKNADQNGGYRIRFSSTVLPGSAEFLQLLDASYRIAPSCTVIGGCQARFRVEKSLFTEHRSSEDRYASSENKMLVFYQKVPKGSFYSSNLDCDFCRKRIFVGFAGFTGFACESVGFRSSGLASSNVVNLVCA
jgi:hypothetical protein